MADEGISKEATRLAAGHLTDQRPAWLWNGDGSVLVWRNPASRLFQGKVKKAGVKLRPDAQPMRGQVARLIRLGTVGRPSLARLQFLLGRKPASATCTCTPVLLADGEPGLFVVAVDPIPTEVIAEAEAPEYWVGKLFGQGVAFVLFEAGGGIGDASIQLAEDDREALARAARDARPGAAFSIVLDGTTAWARAFGAGPDGARLVVFEDGDRMSRGAGDVGAPVTTNGDRPGERPPETEASAEPGADEADEPEDGSAAAAFGTDAGSAIFGTEPKGLDEEDAAADAVEDAEANTQSEEQPAAARPAGRDLSALFDRLAGDEALFLPLGPLDDEPPASPEPPRTEAMPAAVATGSDDGEHWPETPSPEVERAPAGGDAEAAKEVEAADAQVANETEAEEPEAEEAEEIGEPEDEALWTVTGRGFTRLGEKAAGETPATGLAVAPESIRDEALPEDDVERVSRYNFDELSRILADRVGSEEGAGAEDGGKVVAPAALPAPAPPARAGALLNLSEETLVLNRLPLAVLIYRDQSILFANRALVELTGYSSIEELRSVGLGGVLPSADVIDGPLGPVSRLARRNGAHVHVNARLQSVTWQGAPAMLLTARAADTPLGNEAAVRGFAELLASARNEGFFEASRAGIVEAVSGRAAELLGRSADALIGRPLIMIVPGIEPARLRQFIDRPARFAETARPHVVLHSAERGVEIVLFSEGRAGIVTGYFGLVRRAPGRGRSAEVDEARDRTVAILGRLSRGVRRPLNTVVGFSELMQSEAFGEVGDGRYLEYARDIRSAGYEIAGLIDELDEFVRLEDGRYSPAPGEIDLAALLERCAHRVRAQAGRARVLVRTAISEHLPRIRADEASLAQGVLNLLASAIGQTPPGGRVVLSAQSDESDGSVTVHVRDSSTSGGDSSDEFVVFRDGTGKNGEALAPVRSSVGLALTRSLLAVNACSLSVDPTAGVGTLFSLTIPAELVIRGDALER